MPTTTCHLQILPDYYICNTSELKIPYPTPNTNSRYRRFNQIHFTAGDEQQFNWYRSAQPPRRGGYRSDQSEGQSPSEYRCSPEDMLLEDDVKEYINDNKTIIKLSDNTFKNFKISNLDLNLYQSLDKKYVDTTFRYLFHKFKKGIFVKIHSNTLKVFLPFSKANFTNEWHTHIKHPPNFPNINEFVKFACSLGGFTVTDNKINAFVSSWYSNNCLLRHEFPPREGDSGLGGVKDMLLELCKSRTIPDIEFFINKRDFPLLKKDLTEPYESLYNNKKLPLLSFCEKKYYPILSMTTSEDFADIPIPTLEDWARVSSIEDGKLFIPPRSYRHTFNLDFSSKTPIALFRGASTGEGTDSKTNIRLKLAELSNRGITDQTDGLKFLDAGITKWNSRIRKEFNKDHLTTIDYNKLPFGLVSPITPTEQSNYKYIINVDGHCSAFRLSLEFGMGSVILLVKSRYKLWFHDMIKPWVHYVPVSEDLEDLIDRIKWCKTHPQECQKIVDNSLKFYRKVLGKNGIMDYMQYLLVKLRKVMGYDSKYNKYRISEIQQYLITKNLKDSRSNLDLSVLNTQNKLLDKGGVQIYRLPNNQCLKYVIKEEKYRNKYLESLNEIFVGVRCLNNASQYIPNFPKINSYYFDENRVTVSKDWVEGLTLDLWIKSEDFNMQDFVNILLQVNLSLFFAQSLYGFIHFDLYPWNIVVGVRGEYILNYPWIDGKMVILKSRVKAYIIDYGKSSTVYRGIRYGSLKYCTIHDTLSNLLSTLFEVIRNTHETTPILKLSNFVSNTKFRETPFKNIRELRIWLKDAKKYDNMLMSEKYELSDKTSVDFVKYILSVFNPPGISIKDRVIPSQPLSSIQHFKDIIKNLDLRDTRGRLSASDKFIVYHMSKVLSDVMTKSEIDFDTKKTLLDAVQKLKLKRETNVKIIPIPNEKFIDLDSGLFENPGLKGNSLKYISAKYVKEYILTSEIYFPNPEESMAVYSHFTYLFYSKILQKQ